MIVLALVLLIIVLVFCVAIVVSNPDVYQLSLFRVLVPVTSAGIFFTGFGAALVTITALLLLRTGIRRNRDARRRLRTANLPTPGPSASTTSTAKAEAETATSRADDPAERPTTSVRDLDPGEDSSTVPLDRRTAGTTVDDRDEPRT